MEPRVPRLVEENTCSKAQARRKEIVAPTLRSAPADVAASLPRHVADGTSPRHGGVPMASGKVPPPLRLADCKISAQATCHGHPDQEHRDRSWPCPFTGRMPVPRFCADCKVSALEFLYFRCARPETEASAIIFMNFCALADNPYERRKSPERTPFWLQLRQKCSTALSKYATVLLLLTCPY